MPADTGINDRMQPAASSTVASVRVRHQKKRGSNRPGLKRKMTPFERSYSELGEELIPEKKRIDYVLVHPHRRLEEFDNHTKKLEYEKHENNRGLFEETCRTEGLLIQKDIVGRWVYTKLHAPFKRLCLEAERINAEMPLKDCEIYEDGIMFCLTRWIEETFETDDEIDFVSAPFLMDRIHLYEGYEDPSNFFKPAVRSFLIHTILINMDIRHTELKHESSVKENDGKGSIDIEIFAKNLVEGEDSQKNEDLDRHGLPFLLMKGSYTESFILHDESETDPIDLEKRKLLRQKTNPHGDKSPLENGVPPSTDQEEELGKFPLFDPRKDLNITWTNFTKFQPLWKIRNYFGEKIALYFAWSGQLASSLWFPAIFGLCIFFFGISESVHKRNLIENGSNTNTTVDFLTGVKDSFSLLMTIVKESFDNEITPYFALIICLWGTVFLEFWKRKNSTLSYEWDVDQYENNEPDRPQFYGIKKKPDPVTQEPNWYYPVKRKTLKYLTSFSMLLFMVLMVFISVVGVIVYRLVMSVDFCPNLTDSECLIVTSVMSSVLNAVSILILGKVYDKLAVMLTDWENHRTQTSYDDALIIKLFGFQFANSYTSCFYIAFFRGRDFATNGVFGLGPNYVDGCTDNNCMAQLSFQILVLMILKPFPKFLKDIILPFLKKLWRKRPSFCCSCCSATNKVDEERVLGRERRQAFHEYLDRERCKPVLGDFTLAEYTEKVILYGYLMLFAASFPLAPLIAMITLLIDIRVDAKRLLWWYRRPVAFVAQDLGMWYSILNFLNVFGVVTNSFLIAFTSSWGNDFKPYDKLWVVLIFEHLVFSIKFLLAYMIPDVPADVRLAIRREKYQVNRILEKAKKKQTMDFTHLIPTPVNADSVDFGNQLPPISNGPENIGSGTNNSRSSVNRSGVRPIDTTLSEEEETGEGISPYKLIEEDGTELRNTPSVKLSYGKDGTTYEGIDEKFPEVNKDTDV